MRRWMPVQLKRALKSPGIWAVSILALLTFLLISSVTAPRGVGERAFGLYAGKGDAAARIAASFRDEEDPAFKCIFYTDRTAMQRDVLRGKIDCAFELEDNLDQIVENDEQEGHGILYYQTPSTHNGLVMKEKVFSCVMQAKSEAILAQMAADRKIFPTGDERLEERLLQRQRKYMQGD